MQLQWDKLFINNEVFLYCEETGSVEHETEVEVHCNVSLNRSAQNILVEKKKNTIPECPIVPKYWVFKILMLIH